MSTAWITRAFEWVIALDQAGYPHREKFVAKVRERGA